MSCSFEVFTLFPEAIQAFCSAGLLGKALDKGLVDIQCTNYRDFTSDRHHTVDDTPFGGGAGMVIKPEPVVAALEHVVANRGPLHTILLTPSAPRFDQAAAYRLAGYPRVGLLCGRYEGIDDRIRENYVDECLSIGDFVLGGGEVAALVVIEAVSRLVEGVLGNPESTRRESFATAEVGALLEHPHYTRPVEFRGHGVPPLLQQGNHDAIDRWRLATSIARTWALRPDLRPELVAPQVPWILSLPGETPPQRRWFDLASCYGVSWIVVRDPSPERLERWKTEASPSDTIVAVGSDQELHRKLKKSHGEPWWIVLKDASSAQLEDARVAPAVWDQLTCLTESGPGAVVVRVGADPVVSVSARARTAMFAPESDGAVPGEPAKTREEGLATEAAIADASRPSLQLATWVERALAELKPR